MDSVHLHGAEDVRSAGNTISHAADTMTTAGMSMGEAAQTIKAALEAHQQFMDNWLEKFIIARNTHE